MGENVDFAVHNKSTLHVAQRNKGFCAHQAINVGHCLNLSLLVLIEICRKDCKHALKLAMQIAFPSFFSFLHQIKQIRCNYAALALEKGR